MERVQALVALFCEGLIQQMLGVAVFQGTKTVTNTWLDSEAKGLYLVRDPALRRFLNIEGLALPEAPVHVRRYASGLTRVRLN